MATFLVLTSFLGLLGVLVFGLLAIANRADMAKRRKWNGWLLGSFAVGIVCVLPFVLGVHVG